MATLYLGLDFGSDILTEVTTGTSTTGKDIEVVITPTCQIAGLTRTQLAQILTAIGEFVTDGGKDGAGANLPIL